MLSILLDMNVAKDYMILLLGGLAAAVSGAIHLYLAVLMGLTPLGLSFIVAGVGFFAGIALFYLDYRRKVLCLLGVPFVVGQIVLWYMINRIPLSTLLSGRPVLDVIDKVAQIILIPVLLYILNKEF